MKKLVCVLLLNLMACGTDEKETSVVKGSPVALEMCFNPCIPNSVSNGTFSLDAAPGVCSGEVIQPKSCCEYKDLPQYRECQ